MSPTSPRSAIDTPVGGTVYSIAGEPTGGRVDFDSSGVTKIVYNRPEASQGTAGGSNSGEGSSDDLGESPCGQEVEHEAEDGREEDRALPHKRRRLRHNEYDVVRQFLDTEAEVAEEEEEEDDEEEGFEEFIDGG